MVEAFGFAVVLTEFENMRDIFVSRAMCVKATTKTSLITTTTTTINTATTTTNTATAVATTTTNVVTTAATTATTNTAATAAGSSNVTTSTTVRIGLLTAGEIAGTVVGSLAGLGLLAGLSFLIFAAATGRIKCAKLGRGMSRNASSSSKRKLINNGGKNAVGKKATTNAKLVSKSSNSQNPTNPITTSYNNNGKFVSSRLSVSDARNIGNNIPSGNGIFASGINCNPIFNDALLNVPPKFCICTPCTNTPYFPYISSTTTFAASKKDCNVCAVSQTISKAWYPSQNFCGFDTPSNQLFSVKSCRPVDGCPVVNTLPLYCSAATDNNGCRYTPVAYRKIPISKFANFNRAFGSQQCASCDSMN
ncbi:hypothetical protein HELRODRAFT_159988 [Helobdella robusta]|uniref:Uncharacterized protein n=1 Tax=Helobdella robusta TaxID=6412 RepID=T1EPM4_HELRO|nr:hypothetical protein HELRODRAFT_159988 [Helobdella robusta]ESO05897.1 hypothetical protein HELRODRAFT_159988 [Helobdella robusta]